MPDRSVSFTDGTAGPLSLPPMAGGDFILRRADGIIGYQLAVVVDDADMGITDVLRGWDLLDSTPRQLLLFEALRLPAPQYTHVPLLLGPDGSRLSKRHGSVQLAAMRAAGAAPERTVGWLLHAVGLIDKPEPLAACEAIPYFDAARLPHGSVRIDEEMLKKL